MKITRLEKTLYRLQSQHACLAWAFDEISGRDGVVFELGLGLGRTYNHMAHHLPDRRIIAFDRKVDSYPDCTPPEGDIIIGEMEQTLPQAGREFAGQVVLAHTDIGSFDREQNKIVAQMMSDNLLPALAPDAIIMSDLPLSIPETRAIALPENAIKDRYYLYRRN